MAAPALREYQLDAVANIHADLNEVDSTLFVGATGVGKTNIGAQLAKDFLAANENTLVLAHRHELIYQFAERLTLFGMTPGIELGAKRSNGERVVVASVQSMNAKRLARFSQDHFQKIIVDECFPAGTLVDGSPIETLRVGNLVRSYNHTTGLIELKPVRQLFCSKPALLVTVHMSNGVNTTCTAGHPFFTDRDYVPAAKLATGDVVYGHIRKDLCSVRDSLHTEKLELLHGSYLLKSLQEGSTRRSSETIGNAVQVVRRDGSYARPLGAAPFRECEQRSSVLHKGTQETLVVAQLFRDHGANKPSIREPAHDGEQPYASCRTQGKDERDLAENWARPNRERGQRHRAYESRSSIDFCATGRMGSYSGAYRNAARERVSLSLQDRCRQPRAYDCDRDRRFEPLCAGTPASGPEERSLAPIARVVCVEVHEQGSDGGFGELCPDNLVYNIEVEGNHNYFVDNVLVHNCHHAPAKGYQDVFSYFSSAKIVGITATPDRADGIPLANTFKRVAAKYDIKEAIQDGYLVPIRALRVEVPGMDLSKVRQKVVKSTASSSPDTSTGAVRLVPQGEVVDLHPGDLGRAAIAPLAIEGVVVPLLELAEHRRTIVFCVDVAHVLAVVASINAKQPDAARPVYGDMNKDERAKNIEDHKAGKFQFLVNVLVLTEGYDDPKIECVAMARPTMSRILFAQACGRGLRPCDEIGKTEALILDFVGTSCQFDLVGPADVLGDAMVKKGLLDVPFDSSISGGLYELATRAPSVDEWRSFLPPADESASTTDPMELVSVTDPMELVRSVGPIPPYKQEVESTSVTFTTKAVDLLYRTGHRAGKASGKAVKRAATGAVRVAKGVKGWFAWLFGWKS